MRSLSNAMFSLSLRILPLLVGVTPAISESLPNLTVLLTVEGKASDLALKEMRQELNAIMHDAGRKVEIRLKSQAQPFETFEDLVVVKLNGSCSMENMAAFLDERGPLAWAHSTDGVVLPFAEVACDRIAGLVGRAMWGGERREADKYLGRALGRVLAHELHHILGKTHHHNEHGELTREALTAKRLISDKRISFDPRDLEKLIP